MFVVLLLHNHLDRCNYLLYRGNTITKAYLMEEYAKEHFQQRQGFFSFTKTPIQNLLTFSSTPLQYPLTKIHRILFLDAFEFNKRLWEYTDLHRFVNDRFASLKRMLFLLLLSPSSLVDEYYCQVIKQMTACPIAYGMIDHCYLSFVLSLPHYESSFYH